MDSNDKEITLGDALNQVKDASPTSLEELQNLAGGADIKVTDAYICLSFSLSDMYVFLLEKLQ